MTDATQSQRARLALLRPGAWRPLAGLGLAFAIAAALIAIAGANPLTAFGAALSGAFGSPGQVATALTKATPYLLCSTGVALCFRAGVINIGGEGQIALGGLAATAAALAWPIADPFAATAAALAAGALGGLAWAALAAVLHLTRRVHEVLITLLMNFIALLMVDETLREGLGEVGAGFPQSPLLPRAVWLTRLMPPTSLNVGVFIALAVALLAALLLWRTTFGFAIRATGASRRAAAYAGFSVPGVVFGVMCLGGATAGLAGAVQVMGVQYPPDRGLFDRLRLHLGRHRAAGRARPAAADPGERLLRLPRDRHGGDAAAGRGPVGAGRGHRGAGDADGAGRDGLGRPPGEGVTMDWAHLLDLLAAMIRIATPLAFAAMGGILSERAGVFAVGLEGMMLSGACGAAVGAVLLGPAAGILGAALCGAAMGAVIATVTVRHGADNMVTGIAANILAIGLTNFLVRVLLGHGAAPRIHIDLLGPVRIPLLADLPGLGPLLFDQPWLTYMAALVPLPLTLFLSRSRWGLTLRAAGENPLAVFAVGGDPLAIRFRAVVACGAVAGIGGAVLVLGQVGTFTDNMTAGRGYLALAAIIVGRWTPWPTVAACLLFAAADALTLRVQVFSLPVSSYVVQMLPYALALAVLVGLGRSARLPAAADTTFRRGGG